MKHLLRCFFFGVAMILTIANSVLSGTAEIDSSKIFYLGEIIIYGNQQGLSSPFQQHSIAQSDIQTHHRLDVSHALDLLPGLHLSNSGSRNESMVYVRGFDLRQVPVFIDGIPEYIPYDGYVDLARFTTFDLSEITVTKGFSSVLYGANAMGGAINLVSRKPDNTFEYNLSGGIMNAGGYNYAMNVGTNQGMYYVTGSFSRLKQNSIPLSKSFTPTFTENGGERDNSYRKDTKTNIKVGFTPNETDEYSFSYINQQGKKGNPVYTGYNSKGTVRYWQWPNWDKYSEYFISQTLIGNKNSTENVLIKTRIFHDKFKNTVFAYDNALYTTQTKKSSFRSFYDDDTWGAFVEGKTQYIQQNNLTVAFHWKHDIHREHNLGEPQRMIRDATISAGVEDVYNLLENFSLIGGISYDLRKCLQAQDYNSKTKVVFDFQKDDTQALNFQFGGIFNLTSLRQLSFSIARKTRFATMKDRYSYKLGTAIPNPGLVPENAINYDFAYREVSKKFGSYSLSFFYNDLHDVIQQVTNAKDTLSQMQNLGKARYYGCEIEIEVHPLSFIHGGANYTFLKQENLSNPEVKFLDTPDHKVILYANLFPLHNLDITASMEFNSKRNSTSDGLYSSGDFTIYNLRASLNSFSRFTIDAGIQNIFDKNYSLIEGYPEAGRTFYATLHFHD